MNEVEILKIGTIIPNIKKGIVLKKPTIMIVHNTGDICETYVKILTDNCHNEYSFMKTSKEIVGTIKHTFSSMRKRLTHGTIKGILEEQPEIGKVLSIGNWETSEIINLIDGCVVITQNSVYAIHDLALIREKKLNDLGI